MLIRIKKVSPDAILPKYMSTHAAGMDMFACLKESIFLKPMERSIIPTGVAISLPVGYEAQIRPRSGLAIKHGITLLNSPGTIDADYRGEIKIILINLGENIFKINHGERIAQMVISRVVQAELKEVKTLDITKRGSGGFGSTGK